MMAYLIVVLSICSMWTLVNVAGLFLGDADDRVVCGITLFVLTLVIVALALSLA